jgi:hypothetical protein
MGYGIVIWQHSYPQNHSHALLPYLCALLKLDGL